MLMGAQGSWDKAGVKERGDGRSAWDRQDQGRRTGARLSKITQDRAQRRGAVRVQGSSTPASRGVGWDGDVGTVLEVGQSGWWAWFPGDRCGEQ